MWRVCVLVCACVCVAVAQDDDNFNLTPTGSRVCKSDTGSEGVCVSYAHCYPNKTLNIYGNIDLNEERISGCHGDLNWCCALPVDLDVPNTPSDGPKFGEDIGNPVTEGPASTDVASCPDCVKLYRSGGNPRTRSATGLFCGGVWLSRGTGSAPHLVTSSTCGLSTRDQRVWGLSAAGNYTLLAITTHPEYNSGTRVWDVAVADVVGPPPPRGSAPSPEPPAPADLCTTYHFDRNENIVRVQLRISPDPSWAESVPGTCGVEGGPVYCGGRVWAVGAGRGAGGRCRLSVLQPALSWIFPEPN